MKKNCANCNVEFEARDRIHKFCKEKCKHELRIKSDSIKRRSERKEIECAWCGKRVTPPRKLGKTCGGECAKQYRKKHKAERVKVHIIDKKCPTCGRADFKQWSNFNRHARTCKEKACVMCGKMFFSSRDYTQTCGCRALIKRKSPKGYPMEKKCAVCTSTFAAKHGKHLYCRRACKDKQRFTNPVNVLSRRMSDSVRMSLKQKGTKKANRTFEILGFDKHTLREHLESQFTDDMSWGNMSEWHIDHIRPVSSFNFDSTEHPDFKKCWALNNLQPLWALDNLRKNDKWDGVVNA